MAARRDRTPPATGASEKEVLVGFLDYLRECAAAKVEGVAEPAARTAAVPSGTNLLGLIKHLTAVERFVFLGAEVRSWPATFKARRDETVDGLLAEYRRTVAATNAVIAAWTDLAGPVPTPSGRRSGPSMRWALTHMIEETGRHAGHLDIVRELIDGSTGR